MGICAKPKRPKASAQDVMLARLALEDQKLYETMYLPAEREQIAKATDPVRVAAELARLRGQSATDVEIQAVQARLQERFASAKRGNGLSITGNEAGIQDARTGGLTEANVVSTTEADRRSVGLMGQGLKQQGAVTGGMASAASRSEQRVLNRMENRALVSGAKMQAVGQAVGGLAAGAFTKMNTPVEAAPVARQRSTGGFWRRIERAPQAGTPNEMVA